MNRHLFAAAIVACVVGLSIEPVLGEVATVVDFTKADLVVPLSKDKAFSLSLAGGHFSVPALPSGQLTVSVSPNYPDSGSICETIPKAVLDMVMDVDAPFVSDYQYDFKDVTVPPVAGLTPAQESSSTTSRSPDSAAR